MLIDARTLENNSIIEGDICIIGAGAAGISAAMEFNNTKYKVILLEGGGMQYEERTQELVGGSQDGQKYYPIKSTRLHYFGGTTGHWGGFCSMFDPIAFRKRDWVNMSGWPITQEDLMPFYRRANTILDLNEFNFDVNEWQKKDPKLIPMPIDKSVFWHKIWRFSPPTKFGEKYRKPVIDSANIHLYTYAHAASLEADEQVKNISEVIIKNYAGKTHRVRARYVIMACCSLQNTRLLLNSTSKAPKGIGNDNDNVGRYFMEHAELKSAELWLNDKRPFLIYENMSGGMRAELAVTPEYQEKLQLLNGIMSFIPLYLARKIPAYIKSWSNNDPRENEKHVKERYDSLKENRFAHYFRPWQPQAYQIVMRLEQAPNRDSRITLNQEKDELGIPKVHLHWILGAQEKRSGRMIYELLGQQMGKAGLGRVRLLHNLPDLKDDTMPETTSAGWHHMGATRMTDDPKTGVVDANCRVHGMENLYIASSSCFTTGGGVNPTMTIVALSLRVADHIKQKLGS